MVIPTGPIRIVNNQNTIVFTFCVIQVNFYSVKPERTQLQAERIRVSAKNRPTRCYCSKSNVQDIATLILMLNVNETRVSILSFTAFVITCLPIRKSIAQSIEKTLIYLTRNH